MLCNAAVHWVFPVVVAIRVGPFLMGCADVGVSSCMTPEGLNVVCGTLPLTSHCPDEVPGPEAGFKLCPELYHMPPFPSAGILPAYSVLDSTVPSPSRVSPLKANPTLSLIAGNLPAASMHS